MNTRKACKQCPWPYTTVFPGETECVGIAISLTFAQQVTFGVAAMVIYLSCCALARLANQSWSCLAISRV